MDFTDLVTRANSVRRPRDLSPDATAGTVGAALETDQGNVYLGVCIDVPCSLGFCAEHAAIAAMITAGESRITRIVAVGRSGVMPPCGRCREFMVQVNHENLAAEVMVAEDTVVTVADLLPYHWQR